MTFEEKILGYLDDSLPTEEREEVLHEAHTTREARALLDAHVRLGSLYALTAKPVSAPLDIQRELALKVPILAVKLPYLAMPEKRRKGIVAWFWESKLNMFLVLAALLLGAGIWFAATNDSGIDHPASITVTAPPATGNSSTGTAPAVTNHEQSGPSTNTIARNGRHLLAAPAIIAKAPTAHASSSRSHERMLNRSQSRIQSIAGNQPNVSNPHPLANIPNSGSGSESKARSEATEIPAPSTVSVPIPSMDTFGLPPLRAIAASPSAAALHSSAMPIPILGVTENNSYTPLRAFVEENIRSMRIAPQAQPSDVARQHGVWQTSITSEAEEFGIDYELSPWIAIGARGGNARFIQAQSISHSVPDVGSYGRLTHTITETALLDNFTAWGCVAGTYLVNPGSTLQYEFTAGAGDIFLGGFSPTALGEAAATYRITNALALRASLSYQASWTAAASTIDQNPTKPSVSGAAILSTSPKLFASQAFGFSIGVAIHP